MRASTIFGVTLAALMGLGVVGAARYVGLFERGPTEEKKKKTDYQILVASHTLFAGTAATPHDAKVRPLTDSELDFYEKNQGKLLPPVPSAVVNRVLAKTVTAGQPLFEDQFEPPAWPGSVTEKLDPDMRSVNLTLTKERAASGLLRVGERVDILMTSTIHPDVSNCKNCGDVAPFLAATRIARNLKIIVKRDNLWTVAQPAPGEKDKTVSYILQANPYRAALIEYAKSKGHLSLAPAASALAGGSDSVQSDPDNREYRDEERRISDFLHNELIVTDADLERVFNLKARPLPSPVTKPPHRVEAMLGTRIAADFTLQNGVLVRVPRTLETSQKNAGPSEPPEPPTFNGYRFSMPSDDAPATTCKTCGKKGGG
jgi:Flp pilus assembly protein CpaB